MTKINDTKNFVVVLDAATGQFLSSVLLLDLSMWTVSSPGLVIQNNMVYMAMNHDDVSAKPNSYEQRLTIVAYDYPNASLGYAKEQSSGYGKSASLLYASNNNLYLGGSYDASGNEEWGLAFVRIGSSGIDVDSKISILHYTDSSSAGGCSGNIGYDDVATASHITNLGYDGAKNKMFGVSATHNHSGS